MKGAIFQTDGRTTYFLKMKGPAELYRIGDERNSKAGQREHRPRGICSAIRASALGKCHFCSEQTRRETAPAASQHSRNEVCCFTTPTISRAFESSCLWNQTIFRGCFLLLFSTEFPKTSDADAENSLQMN